MCETLLPTDNKTDVFALSWIDCSSLLPALSPVLDTPCIIYLFCTTRESKHLARFTGVKVEVVLI